MTPTTNFSYSQDMSFISKLKEIIVNEVANSYQQFNLKSKWTQLYILQIYHCIEALK